MRTIDEAIAHEREVAKTRRNAYETCERKIRFNNKCDMCFQQTKCDKCADEHEQIAELLEELKTYRENSNGYNKEDIELNRRAMYNKAIDDFLNKVIEKGIIGLVQYNEMSIIAEQLKAGRENE